MSPILSAGDRVIQKKPFDLSDDPGRPGMVLAGPGERVKRRPEGNTRDIVIGFEFALVQFDSDQDGRGWMVRLDELKPEATP